MFYIKCSDIECRQSLIRYLREHEIAAVFHYLPLHSSPAGRNFGTMHGEDRYTTRESERLLRLPMYYGLEPETAIMVAERVADFYHR